MELNIELIERFHEKWRLDKSSGCWIWIASTAGKGYGQIKVPGTRKQIYAHRLSYLIHFGEIAEDMLICHTCDNPLCVKPSHLFVGTSSDNLQDMKAKDRHLHGSRNKMAKLDENKVRHIFRISAEGVSQAKIAKSLGVSQSTVYKVLNGKRYENLYREIMAAVK